jgi:hypothetical protein
MSKTGERPLNSILSRCWFLPENSCAAITKVLSPTAGTQPAPARPNTRSRSNAPARVLIEPGRTMPKISALIHAHPSDLAQLARTLETLDVCDQLLVINYGASKDITKLAKAHGAEVKQAVPGVSPGAYLMDASHDWIFCISATETLSDRLQASLRKWKDQDHADQDSFSVVVAEKQSKVSTHTETRLVNRKQINWTGELPPNDPGSTLLAGELVRGAVIRG